MTRCMTPFTICFLSSEGGSTSFKLEGQELLKRQRIPLVLYMRIFCASPFAKEFILTYVLLTQV